MLAALGVPTAQRNERSALCLLALLDLSPRKPWNRAGAPLLGITEMMGIFKERFGKDYAPNTRETVRRHSIHQFVQLGMALANPDRPDRPINSPATRYQVAPDLLNLAQTYGTNAWPGQLARYLEQNPAIRKLRPRERTMPMIPVRLPDGTGLSLTAGGQNVLVKRVIEDFCPRFTPGGVVVYVGDTGAKHRHVHAGYLEAMGVHADQHGKMPDVVVHLSDRNWLVLIEAVTSHGPIGIKRHLELKALFGKANAGLVFVTAFLTRQAMTRHLAEIAWETEVWVAEAPSHLIHFNGERFLGPYEEDTP